MWLLLLINLKAQYRSLTVHVVISGLELRYIPLHTSVYIRLISNDITCVKLLTLTYISLYIRLNPCDISCVELPTITYITVH